MLAVKSVSAATGASPRTVRRWAREGRHPDGHGVWSVRIGERALLIAAALCDCGELVWLQPSIKARGMYVGQCSVCGYEIRSTLGGQNEAI